MSGSFSWTRSAPPPEPKTMWEYGGPKPDGYVWPPAVLSVGTYLVCEVCGAAVPPGYTERHTEWHGGAS